MTFETWKVLVKAVESIDDAPAWLREQSGMNWEFVSQLPVVDRTREGENAAPDVEEKVVTADYLEFLREQITLNARGVEWSSLLRNRLLAIEPHNGKKLLVATFHAKPHLATLRIHPETGDLIQAEIF